MYCTRQALGIFVAIVCMATFAFAQGGATARISGTVLDQTGAAVPGADITVRNVGTNASRTAVSDTSGWYTVTALPPGTYEVAATAKGFAKVVRTGISLNVADHGVIDMTLKAAIQEQITVQDTAPMVEATNSTITSLVDSREMRELPLNGRAYAQLMVVQPGVQSVSGAGGGYNNVTPGGLTLGMGATIIAADGQRPEYNLYLLDSGPMNTLTRSAPFSGGGDMLGVAAIQEFKLLTQFDAEYGGVSGAIMASISRSGTNNLHGSAFYYRRDSVLDARNYFDPLSGPPPFKRNQFGGTLGGPIVRDKTFFFASYEGLRQDLTSTTVAFVPDDSARNGGIVPVNPAVVPYLNQYPRSNGPDLGGGVAEYSFPAFQPSSQNQFVVRIDHSVSRSVSLFGRYTYSDGSTLASLGLPAYNIASSNRYQYLTLGSTQTLSNSKVNQITLNLTRATYTLTPEATFSTDASLYSVPGRNEYPQIQIASVSTAGGALTFLGPTAVPQSNLVLSFGSLRDDLSVVRGGHTFKFGAQAEIYQAPVEVAAFANGFFIFPDLPSFLSGTPLICLVAPSQYSPMFTYGQKAFALYAQDEFKVSHRLTLSYGLRYELSGAPSERHGRIASMDFQDPTAPPIQGKLWDARNTFAPRLGLAFDPTGSGKTAIHAGVGIYYAQPMPSTWAWQNSTLSYGSWNPLALLFPPFPHLPSSLLQPDLPIQAAYLFDRNLKVPTSVQYRLNIQRELAKNLVVNATYVGSQNRHGIEGTKANVFQPVSFSAPGQPVFGAGQPRRNPYVGEVNGMLSDSNSNYNALVLGVEKRLDHGFQLSADYTFSKALGNFDGDTAGEAFMLAQGPNELNPFNRAQDYAPLRFNVTHKFTLRGVWELPVGNGRLLGHDASGAAQGIIGGWQLATIVDVQTGFPVTPVLGFNNSLDGQAFNLSERPNWAPGVSQVPLPRTANEWFDPSAFTLPAPGTYGNVGRSTIPGPSYSTVDLTLSKSFSIGERHAVKFRWDVFNVLNHTNFGMPNNIVYTGPTSTPAPTAGVITQTQGTSRQMQLGLTYQF